jgi:cystathionine beta-lyase/cystathionine gamma-synthase
VTCTPGKAKKGKLTVACSVKLAAQASVRNLRARFLRGGHVVATATAHGRTLRLVRGRLTRGSYDVVLTYTLDGERVKVRQRVRIG